MEDGAEVWYRYENRRYAPSPDEFGYSAGRGEHIIHLREYRVVKHTPKGVWLEQHFGGRRFVLSGSTKQFACPTVEAAKVSFIARKTRQARIYRSRMDDAEEAIRLVKKASPFIK